MNNTSRLKIYGILAAVVIVVAGVVWFYPRNHSSKVPHVTQTVSTGQAKSTLPKSRITSSNDNVPKQPPTFKIANRYNLGPFSVLTLDIQVAHYWKLNDEEVARVIDVINSTKARFDEILADNATVTDATDNTIKLETNISDEEETIVVQGMYDAIHSIVGADRWKSPDSGLDNFIKVGANTGYPGPGSRAYIFTGGTKDAINLPGEYDSAINYIPFATATIVYYFEKFDSGNGRSGTSSGSTGYFDNSYDFVNHYGKLGELALKLIDEQKNRAK